MSDRKRKHLYSEKEIGVLVKRATELQEEMEDAPDRGLLLEEIEHIAREMGIDPKHLRAAAQELETEIGPANGSNFWGGPFMFARKQIVEGTVSEEQWDAIVQKMRSVTGSVGKIGQVGQTREWKRVIKDMSCVVEHTNLSVRPGESQTTIELRKHFRGGAIIAYILTLLFSISVTGIFLDNSGFSDLWNTAIIAGTSSGSLLAARIAIGSWASRQRKRFNSLMNWLTETVSKPESVLLGEKPLMDRPDPTLEEASTSTSGRRIKS